MAKESILFNSEGIQFVLKQKGEIRKWIRATIANENHRCGDLSFIFCSDDYLLDMNIRYLKHDTLTDIITFDNSEEEGLIEGDIFISIDRVRDNASSFKTSERDELHRVIIHGILHLLGYKDKGKENQANMTAKENQYLEARTF